MHLLNFLDDEDFNRLRHLMGADTLGTFELFDPNVQLSYAEREALASIGIHIEANHVKVLRDKTIALKNSRVWLKQHQTFHVAHCAHVQSLRLKFAMVELGTYQWLEEKTEHQICLECLALLQYQGADARRIRRPEFAEQLIQQFSLPEFFKQFPAYPLIP